MRSSLRQAVAASGGLSGKSSPLIDQLQWAGARLLFHAYIAFAVFSVVGGFLTAPLMSWYFLGDWRFWRYWNILTDLLPHGYRMMFLMLRGENRGFHLSVPLTAAPSTGVDPTLVELSPTWLHGNSCGPCTRCCSKINCPILDPDSGLCRGYNSFFWRYFNCGRYPTIQREIDYYGCEKWEMRPQRPRRTATPLKEGEQVA